MRVILVAVICTFLVACGGGGGGESGGAPTPIVTAPDQNTTLSASATSLSTPLAVVDNDGNRAVVWGEGSSMLMSRYTNGSWQTAVPILSNMAYGMGSFSIHAIGQGNLITAWAEMTSVSLNGGIIRASSYSPVSGWTTPITIASYSAHVDQVKVVGDINGNSVVVWSQREAPHFGYYSLWSSEKTSATNWSVPSLRENDYYDVKRITLGVYGAGYFTLIWQQPSTIYYARYTGSWTVSAVLAPLAIEGSLSAAFSSNGEIVTAWTQRDNFNGILYTARFVPTSGWSTEPPFTTAANNVEHGPFVAINDSGDSLIAWGFSGTAPNWDPLKALRYSSVNGWGNTVNVDDNVFFDYPRGVFITNANDGVIVRRDGNSSLVSYAYNHLTGWGGKQPMYTSAGVIPSVSVAVNLSGSGVIAWIEQVNSENRIRARLY